MKIFVVRHGQTKSNKDGNSMGQRIDDGLDEVGREQAEELSSRLEKFDMIITSPLKRAYETAQIINKKFNIPLIVNKNIMERDSGTLSGRPWKEIYEILGFLPEETDRTKFDFSKYGGESPEDVRLRVVKFIDDIKARYSDKKVLIVSHGGILRKLHKMYGELVEINLGNAVMHEFEI